MARRCQDDQDEITEADDTAGDATFCGSSLGEQWIEEVTDVEVVQTSQEEHLEGEHLKFKAHIRGWKTEIRKERCQQLLGKNNYNLRRALLRPLWKDVLLIPQAWYPEHKPRYETQGWWYVQAGEILGQEC